MTEEFGLAKARFGVEKNDPSKRYRVVLQIKAPRVKPIYLSFPCQFTLKPKIIFELIEKMKKAEKEGYKPLEE